MKMIRHPNFLFLLFSFVVVPTWICCDLLSYIPDGALVGTVHEGSEWGFPLVVATLGFTSMSRALS